MPDAPPAIYTPPAAAPTNVGAVFAAGFSPANAGTVTVPPLTGADVSGTLTSNGSLAVVFPKLLHDGIFGNLSSNGLAVPPGSGAWYQLSLNSSAAYYSLTYIVNQVVAAEWRTANKSGSPIGAVYAPQSPATGTPVVAAYVFPPAAITP